jgi:hypothetical protein
LDKLEKLSTKTSEDDTLSGKSFGATGLYQFNPQGSSTTFVKLGLHHWSFKNQEQSMPSNYFFCIPKFHHHH